MAFEHVPLTEAQLGPAAWKVCSPNAPAPLQGMVARGLAPLPPRDLAMALYQLWVTNTPDLAEQSAKTVVGLPMPILSGALGDATLHPGVLDFLGRKRPHDVPVLEAIVRHRAVDDETLVGLSKTCPEAICDLLAENQDRWLRCPAIVEALYQNPNCRMSVAQRMLELAVRQGLDVSGPHPADTVFNHAAAGRYDLVVAMYHDQGLIPVKLLARDASVNVTVGLPIVRTSPDHGTAFDIAGRGIAEEGSMTHAIELAIKTLDRRVSPIAPESVKPTGRHRA